MLVEAGHHEALGFEFEAFHARRTSEDTLAVDAIGNGNRVEDAFVGGVDEIGLTGTMGPLDVALGDLGVGAGDDRGSFGLCSFEADVTDGKVGFTNLDL